MEDGPGKNECKTPINWPSTAKKKQKRTLSSESRREMARLRKRKSRAKLMLQSRRALSYQVQNESSSDDSTDRLVANQVSSMSDASAAEQTAEAKFAEVVQDLERRRQANDEWQCYSPSIMGGPCLAQGKTMF